MRVSQSPAGCSIDTFQFCPGKADSLERRITELVSSPEAQTFRMTFARRLRPAPSLGTMLVWSVARATTSSEKNDDGRYQNLILDCDLTVT